MYSVYGLIDACLNLYVLPVLVLLLSVTFLCEVVLLGQSPKKTFILLPFLTYIVWGVYFEALQIAYFVSESDGLLCQLNTVHF